MCRTLKFVNFNPFRRDFDSGSNPISLRIKCLNEQIKSELKVNLEQTNPKSLGVNLDQHLFPNKSIIETTNRSESKLKFIRTIDGRFSRESFSCSKVNGFSAPCKQLSGFAPDYLTVEQTTPNQNQYRLNRVFHKYAVLLMHQ